jgi:hypothetical protein
MQVLHRSVGPAIEQQIMGISPCSPESDHPGGYSAWVNERPIHGAEAHTSLCFCPGTSAHKARPCPAPSPRALCNERRASPTLYLWPVRQWCSRLHRKATGSRSALLAALMSILKRRHVRRPASVPAFISSNAARLSSAPRPRQRDSVPTMRSCTRRQTDGAPPA